jgi:CheY-like chemotaxis protein
MSHPIDRLVEKNGTPHTILYVDDEPILLASWAELIATAGYRVLTAHDGASAERVFLAETVHAVILDYELPGMNGAVIAARIRQLDGNVPLILHSSGLPIREEDLALFCCVIAKNNTLSALLKVIAKALPAPAAG